MRNFLTFIILSLASFAQAADERASLSFDMDGDGLYERFIVRCCDDQYSLSLEYYEGANTTDEPNLVVPAIANEDFSTVDARLDYDYSNVLLTLEHGNQGENAEMNQYAIQLNNGALEVVSIKKYYVHDFYEMGLYQYNIDYDFPTCTNYLGRNSIYEYGLRREERKEEGGALPITALENSGLYRTSYTQACEEMHKNYLDQKLVQVAGMCESVADSVDYDNDTGFCREDTRPKNGVIAEFSYDLDKDGSEEKFSYIQSAENNANYEFNVSGQAGFPSIDLKKFRENIYMAESAEFFVNEVGSVVMRVFVMTEHQEYSLDYVLAYRDDKVVLAGLSMNLPGGELAYYVNRLGLDFPEAVCELNMLSGKAEFRFDDEAVESFEFATNAPDLYGSIDYAGQIEIPSNCYDLLHSKYEPYVKVLNEISQLKNSE